MDPAEALTTFLEFALTKRRERYLEFVARPKARAKFLGALPQDLDGCLDRECTVSELPEVVLGEPALLFALPNKFGAPVATLRECLESHENGCLAVAHDGRAGLYRPARSLDSPVETLDAELLFHFE